MSEEGPEYAYSKGRQFHRIASLIVAAVLAGLLLFHHGAWGIRYSAILIFPLSAVWFADELADHISDHSGGWLTPLQAPVALRVAGWLCFGCQFALVLIRITT